MRNIILLGFLLHLSLFAGTDYWQVQHNGPGALHTNQAIMVTMDAPKIKKALLLAPLASSKNTVPVHLEFPTPWGELIAFEIVETPVMLELLA